jgi:hypothetical protein
MNGVPKARAVWSGLGIGALALCVGYFGVEGLLTGQTRALSTYSRYQPLVGKIAVVTAIAYLAFAAALVLFAVMCFTTEPNRQDVLSTWGRRVMIISGVILVLGVVLKWLGRM